MAERLLRSDDAGPFLDTPLKWFECNGRPGFRAVLGGYPRSIIGTSRYQLRKLAALMRQNER